LSENRSRKKRVKKKTQKGETILARHVSPKGLIFRLCEELPQLNNKRYKQPNVNMGKGGEQAFL
jgi:hypothetical protein